MSQWNTNRRSRKKPSGRSGDQGAAAATLLKIVDSGMAAIIFVAPHMLGGRHMLGRFAILSLCIITAVAWFLRQCLITNPRWNRTWSIGIVLASVVLVAFQLMPLPKEWLTLLSPRLAEILPLWTTNSATASSLGIWQTLSITPTETRLALATLLAYGMLFITCVQRIESLGDIYRIMRWIGCSAILVAGFGIIQYFTSNGKFFWFYEHPYSETSNQLKAGFTCRNHFAHFLVLGLGSLLSWRMIHRDPMQSRTRDRGKKPRFTSEPTSSTIERYKKPALSIGLTLVVFAILASLSRGGVLAMASAIGVAAILYARIGLLTSKHVLAGGILAVIVMAALSFSGDYDDVAKRLDTLTSKSSETIEDLGGRRRIWSANLAAFKASWLTGSGAGSHRFIYPLYFPEPSSVEYTHAENGYLQIATENGAPGLLLLGLTVLCCAYWCLKSMRRSENDLERQILTGGIAAALTASAVHSLVDFVWFIPACATITILIIACALRLSQLSPKTVKELAPARVGRISQFNMALAASLAGIWCLVTLYPAARTALEWDGYVLADKANELSLERRAVGVEDEQQDLIESEEINYASLVTHLANVVRDDPECALAHARFAGALLHRFEVLQKQAENDIPINQIREAAQASNFTTSQQLRDWLKLAFGENTRLLYQANYHAHRAVELCPLQGEAYYYLAELSFLEGHGPETFNVLIEQSQLVSPYDVDVMFMVGKSHLIAGNSDETLRIWSLAYPRKSKYQRLIVDILYRNMTAANFLKVFHPDWSSLRYLWQNYRAAGTTDDWHAILPYARELAEQQTPNLTESRAGAIWLWLSAMQNEVGETQEAFRSQQKAFACAPNDFSVRYALAKTFLNMKQYEQAEPHLRWCYARQPDIQFIRSALTQVSRDKMERLASNLPVKLSK